MKVLVVGNGAREHALSWKLSQSPLADKVYVAPGNPGMDIMTRLAPIDAEDIDGLVKFSKEENMGLVVIGPEAPLALGLADRLIEAGVKVFGPKAAAARLETSKSFAKEFMGRHNIPTAAYRTFTSAAEASRYLEEKPDGPIVVKAAGLAQGKGVTVAKNRAEALLAVKEMMEDKRFGEAGLEVVIEDFIDGEEVTVLAFTDGKTIVPMPPVQDHKALEESDTGPNTGGMGAYSPVAVYTPEVAALVETTIIKPTLEGLKADGIDYCGCLYFGLILPSANSAYKGPQVIEYNARFGDPETEVLVLLLKSDLTAIMLSCVEGRLAEQEVEWRDESAACVVLASGGYPGDYAKGKVITENVPSFVGASMAFHGGTAINEKGEIVTAGGRVITVAAKSTTLEKALDKVYARVEATFFEGRHFRRDIAHRELARRKGEK
ncbi:phosphoribosylamine--glycine ligase [Deltaproteobacteria bacterium Smac51]|nr:phosphoribosylamine--glycine ligase [Deltaproteobacteria bacterium Smac51]